MKRCFLLITLLFLSVRARGQHLESYSPVDFYKKDEFAAYFLKYPDPNYPDKAANFHKKGSGSYRITVNPETGKVTEVKVLKSTGVKILDDSAAAALLQWKAKPRRFSQVVIHFTFEGPGENTGSHIRW